QIFAAPLRITDNRFRMHQNPNLVHSCSGDRPMSGSTRDLILDATERLLGRLGYQKTTMEDIAREAGIGKRTIYLHFVGKEQVALSASARIVARLLARLRAIAASDAAPGADPANARRARALSLRQRARLLPRPR